MSSHWLGQPERDDLDAYDPVGGMRVVAAVVLLACAVIVVGVLVYGWPVIVWCWQQVASGAVAL